MMNNSSWAKYTARGFLALFVLLILVGLSTWAWLRQSLPLLDGELTTGELEQPVTIQRDAQGIPFITASSRTDSAFALGFLHAQERFFQMDLLRRNSAGELAELVGEAALEHDQGVRLHQFRARAKRNIAAMPREHQQVLQRYTDGVNYGLSQLGAKPWEYALLRQEPRAWEPADSLLTIFSMYMTLQSRTGNFELRDNALAELLPGDLYQFFVPKGGIWDAPLIGDARGPIDLPQTHIAALVDNSEPMAYGKMESEDMIFGSNNWVVGGALTEHGAAIVADDMHLAITVPNIWYRAGWNVPGTEFEMRGATLPGGPIIVAGSNGKVAWGFTNTTADWGDLIPLEISESGQQYRTPEGWKDFEVVREKIAISGKPASELEVRKTIWGPIVGEDHNGAPLAYRWVAHDVRGANLNIISMETAASTRAAMDMAPEFGIPHQNFVLGDSEGNIGWTVAGPIPRRVGLEGNRSVSWADGSAYWDGYLPLEEHPSVYNPPSHRIWTANSRTMDGEFLRVMGDGGYALGARQQQIRDDLFARERFTEQDLLDIQLDDRAVFLQRWQTHLAQLLETTGGYEKVLAQVENWGARASADSVGYRIVRNFRLRFIDLATAPVLTYMQRHAPDFEFGRVNRQVEYPAWEMLSNEPEHLLNPDFESWQALKLAALDQVLEDMAEGGLPFEQQTWGVQNAAKIQHPLGRAVSAVNWFTAMPADHLPGDSHMPRFQSSTNGASERMVVAPGHEEKGIFHMATGQSAHPLSPFFGNGHRDWVEGNPSSFTEKSAEYVLTLK